MIHLEEKLQIFFSKIPDEIINNINNKAWNSSLEVILKIVEVLEKHVTEMEEVP